MIRVIDKANTGEDNIGELQVRAMLNILVTDTALFFQVGKLMNRPQIIETVDLIMKKYAYWKPEDFKLCFEEAKLGYNGPVYDRMDGNVILNWCLQYDNRRDIAAEKLRESKNNGQFKKTNPLQLPDKFDDGVDADKQQEIFTTNMKLLRETLRQNKIAREKPVEDKVNVQTIDPVKQMHQRWMKQFDTLLVKQRKEENQPGFVRKYGLIKNIRYQPGKPVYGPKMVFRMLNICGYLEYKQWQYMEFVVKGRKLYEVQ
jgi:hypothetical protein